MENFDIHIWELPEKDNEIDKVNDYIIIHDKGALKKISVEKLYEYFGQDYKIENIVKYFNVLLETENKRYESLYSELETSLDSYDEIVEVLERKFAENGDDLRSLETTINKIHFDMEGISNAFKNMESKSSNISNEMKSINDNVSVLKDIDSQLNGVESKINGSLNTIKNSISTINSNSDDINDIIESLPNNIETNLNLKHKNLSKNINDEYAKIVAIIDDYHHETH